MFEVLYSLKKSVGSVLFQDKLLLAVTINNKKLMNRVAEYKCSMDIKRSQGQVQGQGQGQGQEQWQGQGQSHIQ